MKRSATSKALQLNLKSSLRLDLIRRAVHLSNMSCHGHYLMAYLLFGWRISPWDPKMASTDFNHFWMIIWLIWVGCLHEGYFIWPLSVIFFNDESSNTLIRINPFEFRNHVNISVKLAFFRWNYKPEYTKLSITHAKLFWPGHNLGTVHTSYSGT